jgi:hypothetical protein
MTEQITFALGFFIGWVLALALLAVATILADWLIMAVGVIAELIVKALPKP